MTGLVVLTPIDEIIDLVTDELTDPEIFAMIASLASRCHGSRLRCKQSFQISWL